MSKSRLLLDEFRRAIILAFSAYVLSAIFVLALLICHTHFESPVAALALFLSVACICAGRSLSKKMCREHAFPTLRMATQNAFRWELKAILKCLSCLFIVMAAHPFPLPAVLIAGLGLALCRPTSRSLQRALRQSP